MPDSRKEASDSPRLNAKKQPALPLNIRTPAQREPRTQATKVLYQTPTLARQGNITKDLDILFYSAAFNFLG